MSITDFIKIDTVYTRSINIERDSDSSAIVKAYIPTSRAVNTFHRISDTFSQENTPRSWALIGPYGSGKSSFAIFLSHLLENQEHETTRYAHDVLNKTDRTLCNKFENHTNGNRGCLSILITGAPEPLGKRFLIGMRNAAQKYWQKVGRKPKILSKINNAIEQSSITSHEITELVEELQGNVEKTGSGILIILDEFGKFLEYEARHYGANDIYLLQALSELAMKGSKANLLIFTLMHQGFEEYARGIGKTLRNEWSKIQGRFEVVPFLESAEQTVHVISKAFINNLPDDKKLEIKVQYTKIAEILANEDALPGVLNSEQATDLFSQCYPLHPITILLLPVLCQKMAQNERTLFSYLGSKERFGLNDSLDRFNKEKNLVLPWEIYDYFIQNQSAVLTDPITHRRWAEVVTAIERLGDAFSKDVEMLKTIGLLNIIGAQAGFKASKAIVTLCSSNKNTANLSIQNLMEKSIIQFRKFSNEYRVWQGSDFDLDSAVKDEIGQIGHFDLPEIIESLKPLQPVVAHKHTIKKATLRYFIPSFVDINSYTQLSEKDDQQRLIFCLIESADEIKKAEEEVVPFFSELDIVAICPKGDQLRHMVGEVIALKRVEQNSPELNTDPIAQKEFKDRLSIAEASQEQALSDLLESPGSIKWFREKERLTISTKRDLQENLSKILDKIYYNSPIIKNELINREKPSAQGAAARKKLIFAMLNHIDKKDLSIEKFPAEKGIYKSFLQATGLHKKNEKGIWELVPPEEDNEYNFYPVWNRIDRFLEETQKTPKSFADLNKILVRPPFGIKIGVLPLLYLTIFLYNQNELALYEDGTYTPYITDEHIERFMKRPDFFTVQRLKIEGIRALLFDSYAKVLYSENANKKINLLNIARPLAKFFNDLEDYTKQTNRISGASKKAIKAFEFAKSPADLLFNKLPKACGVTEIDPDRIDKRELERFAAEFKKMIEELSHAYEKMDKIFRINIAQYLLPEVNQKSDLGSLRKKIQARYDGLYKYTLDMKGLRPFIEHITDKKGDNEVWFKRLLEFLGKKVATKWNDIDRDSAALRLKKYSNKLLNLSILQVQYMQNRQNFSEDFEIIRLVSQRFGKSDNEKIVKISSNVRNHILDKKEQLYALLSKLSKDEYKVALLADILDEYLTKMKKETTEHISKVSNE
jgi:hypothetical protein